MISANLNPDATRFKSYSFTRYIFSVAWIFSAFLFAQLADGYAFNPILGLVFSCVMGIFAGRIRSTFVLGAYVGFSILLAHFMIASYSMKYSADQFFPSFWGPLDLLIILMMWTAPLIVLIAEYFDLRIADAFASLIVTALGIFNTSLPVFKFQPSTKFQNFSKFLRDQWVSSFNISRAPPALVV